MLGWILLHIGTVFYRQFFKKEAILEGMWFIKNNQKITKDEAINIVETILIKANKENIKLNQKELDVFFKSIKLLELNSKPTTVLTYLLLSILEKEAK